MRCSVDGCPSQAVCRYCVEHRPAGLPIELERPEVGPNAITVDLTLEREAATANSPAALIGEQQPPG